MQKWMRTLALVMAAMMVVFIIGCGDDDDDDDDGEVKTAALTGSTPAAGGTLAVGGTLTLTFDNPPENVTVNGTPATVTGKTATWVAAGAPGPTTLQIGWDNGGPGTLALTLDVPDTTPPVITGGTVSDGDKDVDPEPYNADGIKVEFDEDVTGTIKLTLEDGTDVGWLGKVSGKEGILETVKGKEIGNETTYKVEISVKNGSGLELKKTLTFVTKGKE